MMIRIPTGSSLVRDDSKEVTRSQTYSRGGGTAAAAAGARSSSHESSRGAIA